jgi:hypothetical protein
MELTEGSMSTRSFSFRDIVSGFRRTSFDPLHAIRQRMVTQVVMYPPNFHFRLVVTLNDLRKDYDRIPSATDQSYPHLRREVLQCQCGGQRRPHRSEIRS